jgi:hypothetical protein
MSSCSPDEEKRITGTKFCPLVIAQPLRDS